MSRLDSVAVCITAIPHRVELQAEALASVLLQTRTPDEIHVSIDVDGRGAAWNRNRAWRAASTEWVAFLDDDDVMFPQHLQVLLDHSADADLVYPWFELREGVDPLFAPENGQLRTPLGLAFNDELKREIETERNFIPITVLVRRSFLEKVGGFPQPGTPEWPHQTCEDWGCWKKLLAADARFVHAPERTWRWRWHVGNTSGKSWNGLH